MPFDPTTPLQVQQLDERWWLVLTDLKYMAKSQPFTVPAGTRTDFASVPRLFTWLVPTSGKYTRAAVLHDYLCDTGIVPRNDADGIFRRALGEFGLPTIRRYVMWGAVRLGGWLKGAKFWDVIGIVVLALMVLPIAAPIAALVLLVLAVLSGLEIVVWAILKAFGKSPPGPIQFWWT